MQWFQHNVSLKGFASTGEYGRCALAAGLVGAIAFLGYLQLHVSDLVGSQWVGLCTFVIAQSILMLRTFQTGATVAVSPKVTQDNPSTVAVVEAHVVDVPALVVPNEVKSNG